MGMNKQKNIQRYGFTLAEVLITLVIIGVIAAITIPTLIHSYEQQYWKNAYKKSFAIANTAWISARNQNLIINRPSWTDANSKNTNFLAFRDQFKITKNCTANDNSNCWPAGESIWGVTTPHSNAYAFIDTSGMVWSQESSDNTAGGLILVDINGNKAPNKYGRDRFILIPLTSTDRYTDLTWVQTPQSGDISKISPAPDETATHSSCPSGSCYGTSWLIQ